MIFLDANMPGKNGAWLAERVKELHIAVVFLTYDPAHAVDAFKLEAFDYILKPIDINEVNRITFKYLKLKTQFYQKSIMPAATTAKHDHKTNSHILKRIFINTVKKMIVVVLADVQYLTAHGNYTSFHLMNEDKIVSSKHIKIYDQMLNNHPDFLRIHRSCIINKNSIKSLINRGHNQTFIEMADGSQHKISAIRKQEVINELER